jgi:uncharacterized membrane protein
VRVDAQPGRPTVAEQQADPGSVLNTACAPVHAQVFRAASINSPNSRAKQKSRAFAIMRDAGGQCDPSRLHRAIIQGDDMRTSWKVLSIATLSPLAMAPAAQTPSNGFALAWVVMLGMVAALAAAGAIWARAWKSDFASAPSPSAWLDVALLILCVAGLGVALYLTYVETRAVAAVCGPVGDCNAVQSSSYSKLFGILPVGLLGAVGYVAILAAWLWGRLRSDRLADYAPLAVHGMAVFGALFSIYLTYLELFVIKAVCIWCLSSAVIMALVTVVSLPTALASFGPEE